MKPETRATLNDPELLKAQDAHFQRLKRLYDGETLDYAFVLMGQNGESKADPYTEPERWVDEALDFLAEQAGKVLDTTVFRPMCCEFSPYGVHFVSAICGSHVYRSGDQWWADYLTSPIGQLQPPDLEKDKTWQLAKRFAAAFVEADVRLPLFGLPTIGSSLNMLVNLYGPNALEAMLADPEAVHRDLKVINDALCEMHRWYQKTIPMEQIQLTCAGARIQPPGHSQLCGCTTHLVSQKIYRDFIAPLDDQLLRVYPKGGGMIHLCGAHTQHIPTWREMKSVRALQVNDRAAEDLETYFNLLRKDQIIYLHPTATTTVERGMEITGGERVVIVADVEKPLPTRKSQGASHLR